MEPMAATAKAPFETPSEKTAARNAFGPSDRKPPSAIAKSDSAEETHPPTVHSRREPRMRPPIEEARIAGAHHPDKDAAMLQASEFGGRPGRHAEDESGERFDEQLLRPIGEH